MAGAVGLKKAKTAEINVVPLIDIVLVLLIIFMVITPLIVKQMDVNIPEVDKTDVPPPPPSPDDVPQVVLLMTADVKTFLGNDPAPVPRAELEDRVHKIMQGRKETDRVLFFDAEDGTNYGETVKVLDLVRGAGVAKIGMITDRTNMVFPGQGAAPGAPVAPVATPAAPAPAPAPAKKHR